MASLPETETETEQSETSDSLDLMPKSGSKCNYNVFFVSLQINFVFPPRRGIKKDDTGPRPMSSTCSYLSRDY